MENQGSDELLVILRASPIFAGLPEQQLNAISQLARIEEYPANRIILKEGELSTDFYSILEGEVEVHLTGQEPRRLGRGEFFGETTLVANLTKSAGVIATRRTKCLLLAGSELRSFPSLAMKLLEESARRPRKAMPAPVKSTEPAAKPLPVQERIGEQRVEFKLEGARKLFDFIVKCFIDDYMVDRLYLEQSGWRSLNEISAKTGIPRNSLYARNGVPGPPVKELRTRGFLEFRVFKQVRGRGGEVTKVRIAYDKEPVKRYVDAAILKPK